MQEYQKIPSLYKFDSASKKYVEEFFSPYFEYLKDNEWIVSEKVNGTNIRVYYDGHRVSWSGRTDKSELPKGVASLLQATFGGSEIIFEQAFGEKEVEESTKITSTMIAIYNTTINKKLHNSGCTATYTYCVPISRRHFFRSSQVSQAIV